MLIQNSMRYIKFGGKLKVKFVDQHAQTAWMHVYRLYGQIIKGYTENYFINKN